MNKRALVLTAAALALAGASEATAQSGTPGWNAWLGCWQPVVPPVQDAEQAPNAPTVCVVPGDAAESADILTLADGAVEARETLFATGAARQVDRDGCIGTETVSWSADGRRLLQSSDLACPGDLRRQSSAISALDSRGHWVSAEAVTVAGQTDVRVIRYRPAPEIAPGVPEVGSALEARGMVVDAARTAARAAPDVEDVMEAVRVTELGAVEAWLIESEAEFDLDADRLVELARAGVPDRLIDLMVALSYPEVFAVDRGDREGEMRETERDRARIPRRAPAPWFYPRYGGYYPGYYGGGYYGRPVIVVRNPDIDVDRGGRAVQGRGYTRGGSGNGSGSPSTPRTSTGPAGGGGGGERTNTGRTAKPRGS